MKSFACQLLSNKSTDSYGTYGMRLTLHFWHFGGRLLLGWGREGEKKTGQELWNECQESKRQRGRDWKWKGDPSLADSHRVAQQVGGARQLHKNTQKDLTALLYAHINSVQLWTLKRKTSAWSVFRKAFLFQFSTSINKSWPKTKPNKRILLNISRKNVSVFQVYSFMKQKPEIFVSCPFVSWQLI